MYIEILEILSTNRDLKDKIKEAEKMIRTTRYEELPSFELGLEKGIQKGKLEGKLETAITMIKEFGLSINEVAIKLKLPVEELKKYMENK